MNRRSPTVKKGIAKALPGGHASTGEQAHPRSGRIFHRTISRPSREGRRRVLAVERLTDRRMLAATPVRLGTNLSRISDFNAVVFTDVTNSARDWQTANADRTGPYSTELDEFIPLDANGWPTQVPFDPGDGEPSQLVHSVLQTPGPGTYRLVAEGTGTIRFRANGGVLDPSSDFLRNLSFELTGGPQAFDVVIHPRIDGELYSTVFLYIDSSDPLDPIRNVDLVIPEYIDTYQTQPFVDSYTDRLDAFGTLRFMDWGATNNSEVVQWNDRTTPQSHSQALDSGVSLEYIVRISNQLQRNAWITIPARADDEFVTNTALYLRDNLAPGLKVFVEYSNETWNGLFSQAQYVRDQGLALGLDTSPFPAGNKFVARRSAEIWQVFDQVYGDQSESTLIKVLGSQSAASAVSVSRLSAFQDPVVNPIGVMPDALAIAPYFGRPVAGEIIGQGLVESISIDEILDRTEDDLVNRVTTDLAEQKNAADQFGLWLINYEGGQHLVSDQANVNNTVLNDKLIAANRDPRMYAIYRQYLDTLSANEVALHVHFNDIQRPGSSGSWGLLETQTQSIDEAHKYRAVVQWAAENPPTDLPPKAKAGPDLFVIDGGDGSQTVNLDATASRDFDGRIVDYLWTLNGQVIGTEPMIDVTLDIGNHTVDLSVTDDSGGTASDEVVITVAPTASSQTIVEADFTGPPPADEVWDQTSQLAADVTYSGVQIGSGLTATDANDAVGFAAPFGINSLDVAVSNDHFVNFTVEATSAAAPSELDLRAASFEFSVSRDDFNSANRFVVMSSVDGFDSSSVLLETETVTTVDTVETFSFALPFTGFRTPHPIEFRIYSYGGQFSQKSVSLHEVRLFGAVVESDRPELVSLAAPDNAFDVAADASFTATFDEVVSAGAGSLLIRRLNDGSVVQSIDVQSPSVAFTGSRVVINPPNELESATGYFIEIPDGAVLGDGGDTFAGITGPETWNFSTVGASSPVDVVSDFSGSPADGSTWDQTLSLSPNLVYDGWTPGSGLFSIATPDVLGFSGGFGPDLTTLEEAIAGDQYLSLSFGPDSSGAGVMDIGGAQISFALTRLNWHSARQYALFSSVDGFAADGQLFSTGPITSIGVVETFELALPTADYLLSDAIEFRLYPYEARYFGKQTNLNQFALSRPGIDRFSPTPGSTNVPSSTDLTLRFDRTIAPGAGDILIRRAVDQSVAQTIAIDSESVVFDETEITINPPSDLENGADYYIEIPAGAIVDDQANPFAGLVGNEWTFATAGVFSAVSIIADFSGPEPASGPTWDRTILRSPEVDYQGLTLGVGLQPSGLSDVVGFRGNFGPTLTTLDDAIAGGHYLSVSLGPDPLVAEGFDLSSAWLEFSVRRRDWNAPKRYAVLSSVDGFASTEVIFDTGTFSSFLTQESFGFELPESGFAVTEAMEFRLYAFEGQYFGKSSSVESFSITDTTSPTPPSLMIALATTELTAEITQTLVTFIFDEPVAGFSIDEITPVGGTLHSLTGGGGHYTAIFTAEDDYQGTGSITVAAGGYFDREGNLGTEVIVTLNIDTLAI